MDWFVMAFLRASLVWLGLGVTLGAAMATRPAWGIYYPAHVHMNLLGFVTMMIYGVAYHVIPRFVGRPLRARRLAVWHWWASNAGLALMVAGFILRPAAADAGTPVIGAGGALSAMGAYAFIYNIWRTLTSAASIGPLARSPLPLAPAGRQMPSA